MLNRKYLQKSVNFDSVVAIFANFQPYVSEKAGKVAENAKL